MRLGLLQVFLVLEAVVGYGMVLLLEWVLVVQVSGLVLTSALPLVPSRLPVSAAVVTGLGSLGVEW